MLPSPFFLPFVMWTLLTQWRYAKLGASHDRAPQSGKRCHASRQQEGEKQALRKRRVGHWLGVLAEIEADAKVVLNILVIADNAAARRSSANRRR